MNSYALAFGILGGGVALAILLSLVPRFRLGRTVRSFRRSLDHIDLVALSWSQGLRDADADDLRTTPPEGRRPRERGDEHGDDGGESLV